MEWLNEYAFKAEEKLDADSDLAERVYRRLARRLVENGTGAVSLFGTIKEETKSVVRFHFEVLLPLVDSELNCSP
jgi:guanine deaminase